MNPRAADHPLWGTCDVLTDGAGHSGRLPAQDYLGIAEIPPLDRPDVLPPGGGAAVLNFLARLMDGRGISSVRYRGPYPTGHLFDALSRSFAWAETGQGAEALAGMRKTLRARFSAEEWPAALEAAPAAWRHAEVAWRPDPWSPLRPHADLLIQRRRGVEAVWMRGQPFAAPGQGEPQAGGARVWRISTDGYAAGLLLLGQPWRTFVKLDGAGRLVSYDPPAPKGSTGHVPMPQPWARIACAWATADATPALAGAIAALEPNVTMAWADLPASLSEVLATETEIRILIQSGIAYQFRALIAQGQPASALALMAVSDALGGAKRVLKQTAQRWLARQALPDPAALTAAGETAQARARERLQQELPAFITGLAGDEFWGL